MLKNKIMILFLLSFGFYTTITGCVTTMKADMQFSEKKYEHAIPLYQEYLNQKPNACVARSKLGFSYLKTGKINKAISEFETVLNKDPKEPHAILYLGLAYMYQKEYVKAIKTWQSYSDKAHPKVENEIRKNLTLLLMAESQKAAQKALENETKLSTEHPETNSIAVCYYKDYSPDKSLRAFQKGLAAMVATDLAKIRSLKVIERLRLQALLEEMALGQTGIVDEKTAPRVGRLLRVENIVTGNLALGSVKVNSSLSGKKRGTTSVTAKTKEFYKLPGLIVRDILMILGISMTAEEARSIGVPHTKNIKAFNAFGKGLDAFDDGDWKKAKNLFDLAIMLDPDFDLAKKMSDACPREDAPRKKDLVKQLHPGMYEILVHGWLANYSKNAGKAGKKEVDVKGGSCH